MEDDEVHAERDAVYGGAGGGHGSELPTRESRGHHHTVEAAHEHAIEHADGSGHPRRPAGAQGEHRVEPFVREEDRGHPLTPAPPGHRVTGTRVDLSDISSEVGAKPSSTSTTRHGSRISR